MYCRECGAQISVNAKICANCGVRPLNSANFCNACGSETKEEQEMCINCGTRLKTRNNAHDTPSIFANVAACCFPLVGLILYFVWKEEKPKSASAVCKWAIIGFVLGFILYGLALFLGIISEMMMY